MERPRSGTLGALAVAVVATVAVVVTAFPAQAAFPGANGKIAFVKDFPGLSIYVMNADGSAQTQLTTTGRDTDPAWSADGLTRLRDADARARIRRELAAGGEWPGLAADILVTSVLNPELKKHEGKTIEQIARDEGKDPLDALMDLLIADRGNTARVTFKMSEDDVRAALRILGHYVREEKLLSLEEAIRKMTSLPASRMRLADRGIVRPGIAADLVVFDPGRVGERSTYADPSHYSEGIPYVAVNGQLV